MLELLARNVMDFDLLGIRHVQLYHQVVTLLFLSLYRCIGLLLCHRGVLFAITRFVGCRGDNRLEAQLIKVLLFILNLGHDHFLLSLVLASR